MKKKGLLSVLLVLAMVLSTITPWKLTGAKAAGGTQGSSRYEITDVDPGTVHIKKMGETEEEEEGELTPLFDANEIVRVSIFLKNPSVRDAGYDMQKVTSGSARNYRQTLKAQQASVTQAIKSVLGGSLDVKWNLTLLVNAISAEVKYGDILKITTVPGVDHVELEAKYEVPSFDAVPNTAYTSEFMTGSAYANEGGITGAGTRIAIIDTGIEVEHELFNADAFEAAIGEWNEDYAELFGEVQLMTAADIAAVAGDLNGDGQYVNAKIPYAFNYVTDSMQVDHASTGVSNHGSHVAGIAAGNRYVPDGNGGYVSSADTVGAVGQAPDAQLVVMHVFQSGGTMDSDYMVALEDAIILGCDAANLSLGSTAPGFTFSTTYQSVMDGMASDPESGIVVTISAGNNASFAANLGGDLYIDDVSQHTGGSPGTYVNALTVASADNIAFTDMPVMLFNGNHAAYFVDSYQEGASFSAFGTIAGSHEYVFIYGLGTPEEYAAVNEVVSLEGKVVIVNRGELNFSEKGNNAIPYGPAAVIVANTKPNEYIRMNLDDFTGTFPMVFIGLADAKKLIRTSEYGTNGGVLFFTGTVETFEGNYTGVLKERALANISDFSSWGIPGSLIMKPEITAPGGNIYSAYATSGIPADSPQAEPGSGPDQYMSYSGTSMAAPHIAGLAALMAQYARDYEAFSPEVNPYLAGMMSNRAIFQSLLMSTATPMIEGNDTVGFSYASLLAQGAGLVNVSAALSASSVIMMDPEDNTLTALTGAAADGKVKAELGDDLMRRAKGVYTYSFYVFNIADKMLEFQPATDIFTQAPDFDGENFYVLESTMSLEEGADYTVAYEWEIPQSGYDVDKDGDTDKDDAQAILDILTGVISEAEQDNYDLDAADVDGDGEITSYDAWLLLNWTNEDTSAYVVPAGGYAYVTVTVTLSDEAMEFFDSIYTSGTYIEGFTYLDCITVDGEGRDYSHEHSIPILGYYGSWTDPSMFDNTSVTDAAYGSTKVPYGATDQTNYMLIKKADGSTAIFMGNPYVIEDSFPYDKLAVSSGTTISNITATLIRNAGTGIWLILDDEGEILNSGGGSYLERGLWFSEGTGTWQYDTPTKHTINQKVANLGLEAGDSFTVGYFAVPEYYSMILYPAAYMSMLAGRLPYAEEDVAFLYSSGLIGDGAMVGYTLTIDDTAPEILSFKENENGTMTVTAKDDQHIAFIGIVDPSGNDIFDYTVPTAGPGETASFTFDPSGIGLEGVILVVGDYAGNEAAKFIRLVEGEGPITITKTIYRLTEKLVPGNDYVIANLKTPGSVMALHGNGAGYATDAAAVTVEADEEGLYISADGLDDQVVWTALDAGDKNVAFYNAFDGSYLGFTTGFYQDYGILALVGWSNAGYADFFTYRDGLLNDATAQSELAQYLGAGVGNVAYANNWEMFLLDTAGPVFLYAKTIIKTTFDPDNASEVIVNPSTATLIMDVNEEADLNVTVLPNVLEDKSVSWSSTDERVVTVDDAGHITAVAPGTAVVRAASRKTPDVYGECAVSVVAETPMNAVIGAMVDAGTPGSYWVEVDLSTMEMGPVNMTGAEAFFTGGGRAGNYLYGNDAEGTFMRYLAADGTVDPDYEPFTVNPSYAMLDAANVPDLTVGEGEDTYHFTVAAASANGTLAIWEIEKGTLFYFNDLPAFVAVAYADYYVEDDGTRELYYYAIGEDGLLYLVMLYDTVDENGDPDVGDAAIPIAEIGVLNIGEDLSAYSMTVYEDEESFGLLVADSTLGAIFFIDLLPTFEEDFDGYLPAAYIGKLAVNGISSLFNNDYDAVRNVFETGGTADPEPGDGSGRARVPEWKGIAPAVTGRAKRLWPAEESEKRFLTVGQARENLPQLGGDLQPNAGGGTSDVEIAAKVTIELAEDEPSHNGLISMLYEPEEVTYVDTTSDADIYSVHVDEEEGIIWIAYAYKEAPEAGTPFALVRFETTQCEDSRIKLYTDERNAELGLEETDDVIVEGLGHDWKIDYEWTETEDGYTVTATAVCQNNSEHTHTETVTAAYEVTQEPNASQTGTGTYTATFENELFETQTLEVELPLVGAKITVTDYTKGKAETGINEEATYTGEVEFGIRCAQPCMILMANGDGSYTEIPVIPFEGEYSFKFTITGDTEIVLVLKGDVNLDGKITVRDANLISRYLVTDEFDLSILQSYVADVNGDGKVSVRDANLISRKLVGTGEIDWSTTGG